MAVQPDGFGAWVLHDNGTVVVKGRAPQLDGRGTLNGNAVAIVATSTGQGYWLADSAGRVIHFGDAADHGSGVPTHPSTDVTASTMLGGDPGDRFVTSMAALPDDSGYYLLRNNGAVFTFGSARSYGSPAASQGGRWIAIAATPTGQGYWALSQGGVVRAFGDARFYGDLANTPPPSRVADLAASPTGEGYTIVDGDGGLYSFGTAHSWSNAAGSSCGNIVGITIAATDQGYWLTGEDGTVSAGGDAISFR